MEDATPRRYLPEFRRKVADLLTAGTAAIGPDTAPAWLNEQIQTTHVMSDGVYGARRDPR